MDSKCSNILFYIFSRFLRLNLLKNLTLCSIFKGFAYNILFVVVVVFVII